MWENGLIARYAQQIRYNSNEREVKTGQSNLLQQNFHAAVQNREWFTNITEFSMPTGKVYLSPIMNCSDGFVVSWIIGIPPIAGNPHMR